MNKSWIYPAMLWCFCGATPALTNEGEWKSIQPGIRFHFPADHGSHPAYQTEWWYVTGQVEDEDGNEFGYQFTLFRFGIDARPPKQSEGTLYPQHLMIGHLAVTDIQRNAFLKAERIGRVGAGYAEASQEKMHAWIGDWEIQQDADETLQIRANDLETGMAVDIQLYPKKPPVFHGENGYSQKGAERGNASAYYSWTRLQTQGTLTLSGKEYKISGTSWFDHEWGSSQLGEGVSGWDWFGLHLDDGSELMLYQLRYETGGVVPQSSASLLTASGEHIVFASHEWELTPLTFWKSPQTGGNYPVSWRLSVPKHGIDITITEKVRDTEMRTERSTGITYWEGPVAVEGTVSGSGYMELTGYAKKFDNTF